MHKRCGGEPGAEACAYTLPSQRTLLMNSIRCANWYLASLAGFKHQRDSLRAAHQTRTFNFFYSLLCCRWTKLYFYSGTWLIICSSVSRILSKLTSAREVDSISFSSGNVAICFRLKTLIHKM